MKKLLSLTIMVTVILMSIFEVSGSLGNPQMQLSSSAFFPTENDEVWHITDIINPTLDGVEWIEEGINNESYWWISDGKWYEAHSRQTLVKPDDIFVSLSETFNWTAVNANFSQPYSSFEDFINEITHDPSWWLGYSWGIDVGWHGVPLNRTKVRAEYNKTTSRAELFIWCHITNIPEYIMGEEQLETYWLTGFDLTSISISNLEALQWYEDFTPSGKYYYIYFKAPANILSQYKDEYSLVLDVSPQYQGKGYNVDQTIHISMPSNTEVQVTSPSNMSTCSGNMATFTLHAGDRYPMSFSVKSGPPIKDVTQSFLESAGHWLSEPSTWVAFASLMVLLYTAFSGKRIWSRRKTYYRLYRSMVNIYDHYALSFAQFHQEIENLSRSITRYFVEDKITDDQFDKLLTRRDDLIERARKLQPPVPPKL